MQYDEEFLNRVATALGFEHALNVAVESSTKYLGGARDFEKAVAQAIRMKEAYRDRWKKLLRNTEIPEDQFEKRCLQEIFPKNFGIPNAP